MIAMTTITATTIASVFLVPDLADKFSLRFRKTRIVYKVTDSFQKLFFLEVSISGENAVSEF